MSRRKVQWAAWYWRIKESAKIAAVAYALWLGGRYVDYTLRYDRAVIELMLASQEDGDPGEISPQSVSL